MRHMLFAVWLFTFFWQQLSAQNPQAPINYTIAGSTYSQNFDGLPSSGSYILNGKGPINFSQTPINGNNLGGWQLFMVSGTGTSASFNVGTGSSTGNGIYSLGNSGSTDRSIGSLASSGGIYSFGLLLTNHTEMILNKISISFQVEQWRKGGSGNKNTWQFKCKTGMISDLNQIALQSDSNLNFSSSINTTGAGSLNGNLSENKQTISYTLNQLIWKPGEQLLLRWDDSDETGNDDVCSIDDFSLTAIQESSSPEAFTDSVHNIQSTSATLFGKVHDHFAKTAATFEYDTSENFTHPIIIKAEPDSIDVSAGLKNVSGFIQNLLPGTRYYFKTKANNAKGIAEGTPLSFTTPISLPTVITGNAFSVTINSCTINGEVIISGGSAIMEKGFVWSVKPQPTIQDNKTMQGNGLSTYTQTITSLPEGSIVYVRAYAINEGGIAYGETITFYTLARIVSFSSNTATKTKKDTVIFTLQTSAEINGLTNANFELQSAGIEGAAIKRITKNGKQAELFVHTGTGSGIISLQLSNNSGLQPALTNIIYNVANNVQIDKTPPTVKSIGITNDRMKVNDSINVSIHVLPESEYLQIVFGQINNCSIQNFKKINDSLYNGLLIIQNGSNDITASANIPLEIQISDSAGNLAFYQKAIDQTNDAIDANLPYIKSYLTPTPKNYKSGDTLDFIFLFNEKIKYNSLPLYNLTIGTKQKQAIALPSANNDSLVCRYIIQPGDLDKDGIKAASAITLNNTVITDLAGNTATLSFTPYTAKNILVDAVLPVVSSIITPAAGTYRQANILDFVVNFSKKINFLITDSLPSFDLYIGNSIKKARYVSGNGSNAILFRYIIEQDDFDKDGIKIAAMLSSNGLDLKDEIGNTAILNLNNPGALSGIKINPVTAFVQKVKTPLQKIFAANESIQLIVVYNEPVFVDTSKGIPYINMKLGASNRKAYYETGSGSNELVFTYTIENGDINTNGIEINEFITPNKSNITDGNKYTVPFSLNNVGRLDSIYIDGVPPTILNTILSGNKTYKIGDTISLKIIFKEKVKVILQNSMPYVPVNIGSIQKKCLYSSGSGTTDLYFQYIIETNDLDTNGVSIETSIQLVNAQIMDDAGNAAETKFNSISSKEIKVDGVLPTITGKIFPAKKIYQTGDSLDFVIKFSEKIKWITPTDSIGWQFEMGNQIKEAIALKTDSSNECRFRYIIKETDIEKKGIVLQNLSKAFNNCIRDLAGNEWTFTNFSTEFIPAIYVNPITANIITVNINDTANYKIGDSLKINLIFNEPGIVSLNKSIPYLKLWFDGKEKQAAYVKGTGTKEFLFNYTIQKGDIVNNSFRIDSVINLNKAVLQDTAGFNFSEKLKNNVIKNKPSIDGLAPYITSIAIPTDPVYKMGDTLTCTLRFSENIYASKKNDSLQLKITIGGSIKTLYCTNFHEKKEASFSYIIEAGDLAKKGIDISNTILSKNPITDLAGNPWNPAITEKGLLSNIKIDGISPAFSESKIEQINICENSNPILINQYLKVNNEEKGEKIQWEIYNNSKKGKLDITKFESVSQTGSTMPASIYYTAMQSFFGTDTITVIATDESYQIKKIVLIKHLPSIQNNMVSIPQLVCIQNKPKKLLGSLPTGGDNQYRYNWEMSMADSLHFIPANGKNDESFFEPGSVNIDTWFRRKTLSGTCENYSSPIKITVIKYGLWNGEKNTDWKNPANWCNQRIPDKEMDVVINENRNHTPTISDTAYCRDLLIQNNKGLEITGQLLLFGNIHQASGNINAASGTIQFSGDLQQSIAGNSFQHKKLGKMIVANAQGVRILDALTITQELAIWNGGIFTQDSLYLNEDAYIGPSATNSFIDGKVHVQHTLPGGKRVFYLIGHPFKESIGLNLLSKNIDISGEGGPANGFIKTLTNQPSAFKLNPITGNDSAGIGAGWVPFTHTNGQDENAWKKQEGISILMRGKPGQGLDGTPPGDGTNGTYLPLATTLTMSGEVNTGDQHISIIKDQYAGYNIISNPYPCPIDLTRITIGSSISRNFWIWHPKQALNGGYTTIPFSSKYILPAFGAIIVKAYAQTDNLITITENAKSPGLVTDTILPIKPEDAYYIELGLYTDSIFWDRICMIAKDTARIFYDKNDAEKLPNEAVNFSSISRENKLLSIDARPINNQSVINLSIETNKQQSFRIDMTAIHLPSQNSLQLHDKYLNQWIPLITDSSYSFSTNNDTLSKGKYRFEIASKAPPFDTLINNAKLAIYAYPVPAYDQLKINFKSAETGNTHIKLLNMQGDTVKSISLGMQKEGQTTFNIAHLTKGIYLLEIQCGPLTGTKKIIKY